MTTAEVMESIKEHCDGIIALHKGDEYELYDALTDLGAEWQERFNELDAEE
jgi:hypothetical protein